MAAVAVISEPAKRGHGDERSWGVEGVVMDERAGFQAQANSGQSKARNEWAPMLDKATTVMAATVMQAAEMAAVAVIKIADKGTQTRS